MSQNLCVKKSARNSTKILFQQKRKELDRISTFFNPIIKETFNYVIFIVCPRRGHLFSVYSVNSVRNKNFINA